MADSKHIGWLRKGVDFWNSKRPQQKLFYDYDFSSPNFIGVNFSSELQGSSCEERKVLFAKPFVLDGVDLNYALLRDAQLEYFSLREANLNNAMCKRARLSGIDLSNAKLNSTDLTETRLSYADLRGAELIHANLTDAYLMGAKLDGADLTNAILNGTDLTDTQPWMSLLFPDPEDTVIEIPNFPKEVNEVGNLMEIRRSFQNHYEKSLEESSFNDKYLFYFRGECNDSEELRPTVMRSSSEKKAILRDKEGEMLLNLMSQRPEDFIGATSALSQWVIAQHHGLKTRLLDITRNPLVALFHACEENPSIPSNGILHIFVVPKDIIKTFDSGAISVVANLAKLPRSQQNRLMGKLPEHGKSRLEELFDPANTYSHIMGRLYHFIRQEKPHFKERIDIRDFFRVFVVEPQQSFERIRVQSSAFLISAFHEQFETEKILELNKNTPVYHHYKLPVPANSKKKIVDELKFLNITRETLFPGLDTAAEAIVKRYEERNS